MNDHAPLLPPSADAETRRAAVYLVMSQIPPGKVVSYGELAAMALMDGVIRLLDGVIGDAESLGQESFGMSEDYACLLEYPHYTKPPIWEGKNVPEPLLSGHHAQIEAWRKQQAETVTKARRPDLWKKYIAKSS